jgi:predicted nucleotidyltransferase
MVELSTIRDLGRKVGEMFKPTRVVLFGSYAYGVPSEDSDIDLLVVMPQEPDAAHLAADIRLALPSQYPIDVLVHSRRRLRERLRQEDGFLAEIMEKGHVLYEADDP